MRFEINKIILWPKKIDKTYREIKFYPNSINIITGASRTGKSAIIPIIDYCLGSDKCTIPVDTIRDACEWFGILIKLEGEELLLCRREPGEKRTTVDMYIQREKNIIIPDRITKNTTLSSVKDVLNEIFSMTFLELEEEEKSGFSARPSYRDCMAFLFQPQNIIANADVLFYKADTMEHRKKLINIFPYVLGAITPEILAQKQILERKEKELDKLKLDYQIIKDNTDSWKSEVGKWISIAYEYGLIESNCNGTDSFENMIKKLEEISKKDVDSSKIISNNVKEISDELVELRKEEEKKSKELFEIQHRYLEMQDLLSTSKEYESSLETQRERLEISKWLTKKIDNEKKCPICGNNYVSTIQKLTDLSENINKINSKKKKIDAIPIVFERELQQVDKERQKVSNELEELRKRIGEKFDYINEVNDTKYTLISMSRFLGKLENAVQTYKRIGKDSKLQEEITKLEEEVYILRKNVNQNEINRRIENALEKIQAIAEKLIPMFDIERPNDKIQFLIKDLTIKVKNQNGRDDYLWEIGSASNWLAYHISVLLAFQEYYQKKNGVKVPNFLVIDQPSQVYFPQKLAGNNSDEYEIKNDEDKEAVKKIFLAMSNFLKQSNCNVQIIVTEHAEKEVWDGIDNVKLIERWRDGEKLVPLDWLD